MKRILFPLLLLLISVTSCNNGVNYTQKSRILEICDFDIESESFLKIYKDSLGRKRFRTYVNIDGNCRLVDSYIKYCRFKIVDSNTPTLIFHYTRNIPHGDENRALDNYMTINYFEISLRENQIPKEIL